MKLTSDAMRGAADRLVRVVGAYAAAPADRPSRLRLCQRVLADPRVDGLEIPFGSAGYVADEDWLWEALPSGSAHVLTLVAGTMERLLRDDGHGLASSDPAGRADAVRLARSARDLVSGVNRLGRVRVVGVELQTAPRATQERLSVGASALTESLMEIASWDWHGAVLAVEHCDAFRLDGRHAKGFLPLATELDVIADVRSTSRTTVGASLNWGRSAIEARHPDGAVRHAVTARESGLLVGQMISGATSQESPFGPAWSDAHAPLRNPRSQDGESASVLGPDELSRARLAAGGGLVFDGVKVSVRPESADVERRLATVTAVLDQLDAAWPHRCEEVSGTAPD